jgi:hypothetical protein
MAIHRFPFLFANPHRATRTASEIRTPTGNSTFLAKTRKVTCAASSASCDSIPP